MHYKVGVVGLTQRAFIDAFRNMDDSDVTALCDIDEAILKELGDELGIERRFTDIEPMLQTDIDIVILCTPMQVHGSQAIAAMKNGKHVLCQYIAASTPEEAEELVHTARVSGRRYMFIETDCYERQNMVMKALAQSGALGEPTSGRGYYLHDCKTMGRKSDGSLTWRGELWMQGHGGQAVAVHTCTPLLEIFGERVVEVYAYGPGPRTMPEYNCHDRVFAACRFPSGRVIELNFDIFSWQPLVCGYCLQGTRGCFEFDKACIVEDGKLSSWKSLEELEQQFDLGELIDDIGGHGSAWTAIAHRFMDAIRKGEPPPQGLDDALHITAIGWAAEQSLTVAQPVKVMTFGGKGVSP